MCLKFFKVMKFFKNVLSHGCLFDLYYNKTKQFILSIHRIFPTLYSYLFIYKAQYMKSYGQGGLQEWMKVQFVTIQSQMIVDSH